MRNYTLQVVDRELNQISKQIPAQAEAVNFLLPKALDLLRSYCDTSSVYVENTNGSYTNIIGMYAGVQSKYYILVRDKTGQDKRERITVGMLFNTDCPLEPHVWVGGASYVRYRMAEFCRSRWDEVTEQEVPDHLDGSELVWTMYNDSYPENDKDCIEEFCERGGKYYHTIYELPVGSREPFYRGAV